MRLHRNQLCPIHRSLSCCGREAIPKVKSPRQLGIRRVEDAQHPRGYRELRSNAEMRKLLDRKITTQNSKCALCGAEFTDYGAWVFNTLAWEIARYTHFRIELEGHTGTMATNAPEELHKWELSTERANAARRRIIEGGVSDSQINKVSGFADTVPMPDLDPADEANRRVTVLVKIKDSINSLPEAISSDITK